MSWKGLPNALTTGRIFIAFAFPFVAESLRLPLILIAMATEYLDGELARRFGWQSDLGTFLDPVADKTLFACVTGTLLVEGHIQWWQLIAVGSRDFAVAFGTLYVALRNKQPLPLMKPNWIGKLTTGLQYIAFFVLLTGHSLGTPFTLLIGLTGLVAAFRYKNQHVTQSVLPLKKCLSPSKPSA